MRYPAFSSAVFIFLRQNVLWIFLLCLSTIVSNAQTLPPGGIGLGSVTYYLPYLPFNDAMKCVRWIDVASWDSNGFPTSANPWRYVRGSIGVAAGAYLPDGNYVLTWEGDGDVVFF